MYKTTTESLLKSCEKDWGDWAWNVGWRMDLKPLTCLVGHLFLCEAGLVNMQRKCVRVGGWVKKNNLGV